MTLSETPSSPAGGARGAGPVLGLTRSFIRLWAYGFGGFLLVGIVLMTAYSATANFFFSQPLPGDFEIVQLGVAVAAFAFLPLAQLTRANVVVDIFTQWAGAGAKRAMDFLGSLAAIAFAALLLWRMSEGMIDYYQYSEYTAIIGIPIWVVFPPILFSLLLLLIAALITAAETLGLVERTPDAGALIARE